MADFLPNCYLTTACGWVEVVYRHVSFSGEVDPDSAAVQTEHQVQEFLPDHPGKVVADWAEVAYRHAASYSEEIGDSALYFETDQLLPDHYRTVF